MSLKAEPGSPSASGHACTEGGCGQQAHGVNVAQRRGAAEPGSFAAPCGAGQCRRPQRHLLTCVVVFLQAPLAPSVPHGLPLSRRTWHVVTTLSVIVQCAAFRVEGRGRDCSWFSFYLPHSLFFWWLNSHFCGDRSHSFARDFRLRFRLTFPICMHCLPFPGIGMLVPCSGSPTLVSKIITGLVTAQDLNLYKMSWPSSLTCCSVLVSCACDVWLPT